MRHLEDADPDEQLLNLTESAEFLRASPSSVRVWERDRRIASHRIGNRLFFKVRDLKMFVAASRRPARSEILTSQ